MMRVSLTVACTVVVMRTWGCSSCVGASNIGDAAVDVRTDPLSEIDVGDLLADTDSDGDAFYDTDVEDDPEDAFELPDVPSCGDFITDPGEECDDGNRLNGDGCDWLCRMGDGDTPGPPSSQACRYQSLSGPIILDNAEPYIHPAHPLPFLWTGSEFAAIFMELSPVVQKFSRFDSSGHQIGTDYTIPASSSRLIYPELIWTGSSFGLFYSDNENGIWYVSIDTDGSPLMAPLLVVADPLAGMPAADNTEDGFVLVWETNGPELGGWNYCNEPVNGAVRIQRFGPDGETTGHPGPVTIWDVGKGPPDVAKSAEGFGVVFMDHVEPNHCYTRFVHVSEDLDIVTTAGFLSEGEGFNVKRVGNGYATSWSYWWGGAYGAPCIARFNRHGVLDRPPICHPDSSLPAAWANRLVEHCEGISLIYPGNNPDTEPGVLFHVLLRTDSSGRALTTGDNFHSCPTTSVGGFSVAPVDSATLAVLIARDSEAQLFYFSTTP